MTRAQPHPDNDLQNTECRMKNTEYSTTDLLLFRTVHVDAVFVRLATAGEHVSCSR